MDKKSKIAFAKRRIALNHSFDVHLFESESNVFIKSESTFFEMVTFGKQGLFILSEEIYDWCVGLYAEKDIKEIMDGEHLYIIETKLREYNRRLSGEHIIYLFLNTIDVNKPSGYTFKVFNKKILYLLDEYKEFDNALSFENDIIAVGAYEDDKLVALAGADDVLNELWQIGIDTRKEHRDKGLAIYLAKTIAVEIEKQGRLPYYTTWSLNIASTKVALKAGFEPVWINYFSEEISKKNV
jgi:RimJ/RimL family protein N-acetyltransferase